MPYILCVILNRLRARGYRYVHVSVQWSAWNGHIAWIYLWWGFMEDNRLKFYSTFCRVSIDLSDDYFFIFAEDLGTSQKQLKCFPLTKVHIVRELSNPNEEDIWIRVGAQLSSENVLKMRTVGTVLMTTKAFNFLLLCHWMFSMTKRCSNLHPPHLVTLLLIGKVQAT